MDSAFNHYLVPKLEKVEEDELSSLFKSLRCTKEDLPLIKISDAGLKGVDVTPGDVVRVIRNKDKKELYYRQVVD